MGCSLLLLDDDDTFRQLVLDALDGQGHDILETVRADQALEALEHETFDLLIVDALLPDMTGEQLLERARQRGVRSPAVLVAGSQARTGTPERLEDELGVVLVLRKPVGRGELAVQVGGALERSAGKRARMDTPSRPLLSLPGRLAARRAAYAARLPERAAALAQDLTAARADDREALRRAHRQALKIHGTAATYGYAREGDAAALIEEALETALEGGEEPDEATWRLVDESLERLRGARADTVEARTRTTPPPEVASVLVVDHDPAARKAVEEVAARLLQRTFTAKTVAEALEIARRTRPDAALVDVQLGGDGASAGVSLARRLRMLPGLSDLPLALMSSDTTMATRVKAVEAGATMFLAKPHDSVALEYALSRLTTGETELRPRVLVLDDDADFTTLLTELLAGEPVELAILNHPPRILERLADARPDLLLLDVLMRGTSGFEVCRVLRAAPEWQDLPIVFVSGSDDPEVRLACFEAGGDDFLEKPLDKPELLARIAAHAARARRHRAEAMRDPLTGLLTRRAFTDAALVRLSEARRRRQPVTLAVLDLDWFKQVNDTHGHLAGDRVLAGLGQILRSHMRAEDARGRWGGEEFTLCIYGEGATKARSILERVHDDFSGLVFDGRDGATFQVTFSAGIASFPVDGDLLETLFRRADRRLYDAKRAGRQRIAVDDGEAIGV